VFHLRPTFWFSSDSIPTGGTLVVSVTGRAEDDVISVDLPFDFQPFFAEVLGSDKAVIPFDHAFAPGDYELTVHCGEYSEPFSFKVTEVAYERQDLEISGDGAAANTAEANIEYANTIYPLLNNVADDEIYWDGVFIQPAEGNITTNFGIYRYTNGSETPTRHAAIDIANAEGSPIVAPNGGRVLFSGFLTLSGNTIVIEHGMGLHTLYMHMETLSVAEGDIVEKGQALGTMGTTGYSTGPHLHYQMMIYGYSISPWFAQNGSAGFYSLKPAE
jgi:murein DD-endopeptidase MepM/ murein hydrolase activator NlpD